MKSFIEIIHYRRYIEIVIFHIKMYHSAPKIKYKSPNFKPSSSDFDKFDQLWKAERGGSVQKECSMNVYHLYLSCHKQDVC